MGGMAPAGEAVVAAHRIRAGARRRSPPSIGPAAPAPYGPPAGKDRIPVRVTRPEPETFDLTVPRGLARPIGELS